MSIIHLVPQSISPAAANTMLAALAAKVDAAGPGAYLELGNKPTLGSPFEPAVRLMLANPCASAPVNGEMYFNDIPQTPADVGSGGGYIAWQICDADDNLIASSLNGSGELVIAGFFENQPIKLSEVKMSFNRTSGPAEPVIPTNPEFPRTWAIDLPFSFENREIPVLIYFKMLFGADETHYPPDWFNSLSLEMNREIQLRVGEHYSFYFSHAYHSGPQYGENDNTFQTCTISATYSPDFDQIIITAETSSPWLRIDPSDYFGVCQFDVGFHNSTYWNAAAEYDPDFWNSTVSSTYAPNITMSRPDIAPQVYAATYLNQSTGNYNRGSKMSPQNISIHTKRFTFPLELP